MMSVILYILGCLTGMIAAERYSYLFTFTVSRSFIAAVVIVVVSCGHNCCRFSFFVDVDLVL